MPEAAPLDDREAAYARLTEFFRQHAEDAEFLLVAQYNGARIVSYRPKV